MAKGVEDGALRQFEPANSSDNAPGNQFTGLGVIVKLT
jgi:hypothetical protein